MPDRIQKIDKDLLRNREVFRYRLLDQLIIVGIASAILQFLIDISRDSFLGDLSELVFAGVLGLLLVANRKGYHKFARISTLIAINAAIFVFNGMLTTGGIQYYYFPVILVAFILYDWKEWYKSVLFALLSFILFFVNTTDLISSTNNAIDWRLSSIYINFGTASALSAMAIVFLVKTNKKSEQSLREANKELIRLSSELNEKNQVLAKTNDELDKFMYSSSHDLRAPLSSILGLVNVAKLDTPDKRETYLEMIRDRVNGLDYFIKEIIDFSKNSRTEVNYESLDVEQLIEQAVDHNRYLPGAEKIDLDLKIESKTIVSDSYRISSILTSLIANAVKYHNLNQERPMLWIAVRGTNPVKFIIKDNGSGFSHDVKTKIFDMFYRGSERSTGAGLGLYIAKEMLGALKGKIEVDSEEGVGSTFSFYVPVPD